MKKTFLILTIAFLSFAATYVIAQSVNGQNWVGYVKVPAPPAGDLELIGVNFEAVGSDNGGIPLNELLNTNNLIGDFMPFNRDSVYLWNKVDLEYDLFTYNEGDFYDGDGLTNPVVFAGDAMWFRSAPAAPADRDLYALGQVNLSSNTPVTYLEGLQLTSYPYPTGMVFSNIDWLAEGATTDFMPFNRDTVYIYEDGYVMYKIDQSGEWLNDDGVGGLVVAPGQGFWYDAQKSYTNDYVRPFEVE